MIKKLQVDRKGLAGTADVGKYRPRSLPEIWRDGGHVKSIQINWNTLHTHIYER